MNNPTVYDVMSSIASRRKEIEEITLIVEEFEHKIKRLNQRKTELKNLNLLDTVLLKELQNGTN
jgi:hypothetical protein